MSYLRSTALALSMIAFAGCAQAAPAPEPTDANRAQVEMIIKDYLMKNPELVRDALEELDRKVEREALAAVKDSLKNDSRDPVIGPRDAKVTIVEFFDYNCGFCKRSTDWVAETIKKHPKDVRVVFKELPILDGRTRTSRMAAKAALAAKQQGRYMDMHLALMNATGLSEAVVTKKAKDIGLNMKKFEKDRKDPALDEQLEDALILANRIPSLTGTPFFVINDEFMAGANTDMLQALLEQALES